MTNKLFTSAIFIFFILATILSISSINFNYDHIIHQMTCFRNDFLNCFSGEIMHTISLFFAVLVSVIMIIYWVVRFRTNSGINNSFNVLNIPIFAIMVLVTVFHIIGFALINDLNLNHAFNIQNKKEGYWLYFGSMILFFFSTFMTGIQLFLRK